MSIIVQALLEQKNIKLPSKNKIIKARDAFVLVGTNNNFPVRDLYMLDQQDRDNTLHLGMVKEP